MKKYRIAIVGASIAGCATAFVLHRRGHSVQIFERSETYLVGRGASIFLPHAVFEMSRKDGLIRSDIPHSHLSDFQYIIKSAETLDEKFLGSVKMEGYAFHWSDLYEHLRSSVTDVVTHYGCEVTGLEQFDDEAKIRTANGMSGSFDLVIFADGYRSFGRTQIDPAAKLAFDNLALMRTVVPETVEDADFEDNVVRVLYPKGFGVFYFMPGMDGSCEVGHRRLGCYLYHPAMDLQQKRVSNDQDRSLTEAESDDMDSSNSKSDDVQRIIDDELPSRFRRLFKRDTTMHTQPIYSVRVDRHACGRACVVGDAASLFPPYSTSGVLKAFNNALSLGRALDADLDVVQILGNWQEKQRSIDDQIAEDADRCRRNLIESSVSASASGSGGARDLLTSLHPGAVIR